MTSSRRGFTLLEVLISVMILAILSGLTGQAIQRSLSFKKKIQNDIDIESRLKNAMRLIERDVSLAFHHRNLDDEIRAEVKKANEKSATGGTAGSGSDAAAAPGATPDAPAKIVTQFLGDAESVHLSTLSHIRLSKDAPESNQAEVGFYVSSCRSKALDPNKKTTGKCLFRREYPFLDEKTDKDGPATVLLENVEEFSLKYFGTGKQDWVTSWKTDAGGDDVTRDSFPEAVEVVLKVKENSKEYTISSLIPIRFPNNKEKEKPKEAAATP